MEEINRGNKVGGNEKESRHEQQQRPAGYVQKTVITETDSTSQQQQRAAGSEQKAGVIGSVLNAVSGTYQQARDAVVGRGSETDQSGNCCVDYAATKAKETKEKTGEYKDCGAEKANQAKDYIADKAKQAKDAAVDMAYQAKDYVAEKAGQAKDVTVDTLYSAKDYTLDKAGQAKDATVDTASQAKDCAAEKAKDATMKTAYQAQEKAKQAKDATIDYTVDKAGQAKDEGVGKVMDMKDYSGVDGAKQKTFGAGEATNKGERGEDAGGGGMLSSLGRTKSREEANARSETGERVVVDVAETPAGVVAAKASDHRMPGSVATRKT